MLVSDFHFELPPELIAQQPPEVRGNSRLLRVSRADGAWQDGDFHDFPGLLQPGDLLILNQSRVIPARLFAQRKRTPEGREGNLSQGKKERIEVLLTEQIDEWEWRVLARPARKLVAGQELIFSSGEGETLLQATVTGCGEYGERILRWAPVEDFFARLEKLGHMPLPPYIHRQDQALDRDRYQTVFARERGSVAAPTAGLHFTPEILERIRARGVRIASITLHIGLGTFQPVRVSRLDAIELHSERYTLPAETAAEIQLALREGRRILAVGTTTVRTLEHCAQIGRLEGHSGATRIFISPGFAFRVVSGLLTNFHLPESTLLMLVCAFAGQERVLAAYRHAVERGYRFFSYGDCMFLC